MQPAYDAGDELDLRDYLGVLRRRKLTIIVTTALLVAIAVGISLAQTPIYEATAEVLLRQRTSEQIFSPDEPVQANQVQSVVDTEIEVMESRSVRDAVEAELGREAEVSISARSETFVVSISARSTDADEAAETANTYARIYVETRRQAQVDDLLSAAEQVQARIGEINAELATVPPEDIARRQSLESRRTTYSEQLDQLQLAGELTRTGGAQIVSEAERPDSPVEPQPVRNAAIAAVLGLLLGIGLAFLRDHLDDSVKTLDDLEQATPGTPVLGLIPAVPDWRDRSSAPVVSLLAPHSATSEAYRTLRTSLQFVGIDHKVTITQITSPSSGEGKTTTLVNLGVQLARAGQRVVLVDCDLRRPRIHEFFDAENAQGFTSVLLGESKLRDVVLTVPDEPNLLLLPSGPPPPNPSELLSSPHTEETFTKMAQNADYVLVDSPPVLPVADAAVLSRIADATILVVLAGETRQGEAERAVELLQQVNAPLVGSVLNGTKVTEAYMGYGTYVYGRSRSERRRERRRTAKHASSQPDEVAPPGPPHSQYDTELGDRPDGAEAESEAAPSNSVSAGLSFPSDRPADPTRP